MRKVSRGVAIAGCLSVFLTGCLESTQVSFNITTDIPCESISATAVTVGIEGQTEKAMPQQMTKSCTKEGTVNIVGTYAVKPQKTADVVASLKVAMAVGEGVKVETDCTPANGYRGCVVARRRISFLAHRSLRVPVEMLLICKDVQCDESSSCTRAGRCASSLIDVTKCDGEDCSIVTTVAGEGLPCFNDGASSGLFCRGEESWCTRGPTGMRSCSKAPIDGSASYQCREARDCGPNLLCLAGADGVLGRCAVMATATDTVLCTLGESVSPCAGGPRQCSADAGPGLFACAPVDGGTTMHTNDGGLPCPRTGSLRCSGATPFCSIISGTPTCSSSTGAECWYPSDCAVGNSCYAGVTATHFNACLPAPSMENPVALCNPDRNNADCPAGYGCDGIFYGFRACRVIGDGGVIVVDGGVDAGVIDDGGVDGGDPDAGLIADAGATDGGAGDAGVSDAGAGDGG